MSAATPGAAGSLRDLDGVIERQLAQLRQHAFLRAFDAAGSREQLRRVLPRIAFFTLVFQDILRLAREHCSEPAARAVALSLERGDRGHDHWFLEDLENLGAPIGADWLFSDEQRVSRDVAYALVGSVCGAEADSERLAVLLALEAMAGEFFIRISAHTQRLGLDELRYFGVTHLDAERAHDVLASSEADALAGVPIPRAAHARAEAAVTRTFALMTRYADDLAASLSS